MVRRGGRAAGAARHMPVMTLGRSVRPGRPTRTAGPGPLTESRCPDGPAPASPSESACTSPPAESGAGAGWSQLTASRSATWAPRRLTEAPGSESDPTPRARGGVRAWFQVGAGTGSGLGRPATPLKVPARNGAVASSQLESRRPSRSTARAACPWYWRRDQCASRRLQGTPVRQCQPGGFGAAPGARQVGSIEGKQRVQSSFMLCQLERGISDIYIHVRSLSIFQD
jgi:hypothetical protein